MARQAAGNRDWRKIRDIVWASIGLLILAAAAGMVMRHLALVIVPLVLALFPATLLMPIAHWLKRRGFSAILAALTTLAGGLILLLGVAVGTISLVVAEIPEIADSAGQGVEQIEELVQRVSPGFQFPGLDEIQKMVADHFADPEEGGETAGAGIASRGLGVARTVIEVLTGTVLMIVVLFFYLRGGRRMTEGFVAFVAPRRQNQVMELADEGWRTLGAYFRGQLLVALFDAVFIGAGLLILSIPLALPLATIVFFGGMFPIIGAITTGVLAVLVAFSDGGVGIALAVAAIVLVVQQVESNVLEPLILSNVIDLKPITVLVSITLGAVVLGVLGAFLAVPAVAVGKRVIRRLRQQRTGVVMASP